MEAEVVRLPADLTEHVTGRVDWSYAVSVPSPRGADTLAWARACFESAAPPMRWFLVVGWVVLLLEGPPRSGERLVLGWPVVRLAAPTVLRRRSRLGLVATLVFSQEAGAVIFASAMTISTLRARLVWMIAAPIHRWVARHVLARATGVIGS